VRIIISSITAFIFLLPFNVNALNRCTDESGHISYQDKPCPSNTRDTKIINIQNTTKTSNNNPDTSLSSLDNINCEHTNRFNSYTRSQKHYRIVAACWNQMIDKWDAVIAKCKLPEFITPLGTGPEMEAWMKCDRETSKERTYFRKKISWYNSIISGYEEKYKNIPLKPYKKYAGLKGLKPKIMLTEDSIYSKLQYNDDYDYCRRKITGKMGYANARMSFTINTSGKPENINVQDVPGKLQPQPAFADCVEDMIPRLTFIKPVEPYLFKGKVSATPSNK